MTFSWGTAIFLVAVIYLSRKGVEATRSSQCTYTGYAPASAPQISSISVNSPEKFEESVLEKALGIGETGGEIMEKTLEISEVSPHLALTFGAIALALGIAQNEPSPQDILNRAHESVQLLANDVNERLNQLQDYADANDLELERRIMTRNYKELFDQWQECLTYKTKAEADNCQARVERAVKSARYQFQPLQSKFDEKDSEGKPVYDPNFEYRYVATWQWMNEYKDVHVSFPEYKEVKRLEIGLIPFRNYVTLHLLVLETLIKTHEALGDEGCENLKFFLERMIERSDYYVRYVKWAYEWIYIRQYEENMYFGIKGRAGGGRASADRGGFIGTKKCLGNKCTVECTQIIKDNVCTFNNGHPKNVGVEVTQICEKYLGEVKKQLKAFWKDQILGVAEIWKKYGQQAKDQLATVKCEYTIFCFKKTAKNVLLIVIKKQYGEKLAICRTK